MSFARITYTRALDLIGTRLEAGKPSPTDEEIALHCGLDETAPVRSLLADLADRGDITMRGTGANRAILLGRQRSEAVPVPRLIRSARKALPSDNAVIEAGLAKIKAALARGKAAVGPAVEAPEISLPVAQVAPAPTKYPRGVSGTARKAPSAAESTVASRASGSTPTAKPLADRQRDSAPSQSAAIPVSPARRIASGQDGCGEGAHPSGQPDRVDAAPHPVMAELAAIPPDLVAELSKPALEMVRMPTTQRPVRGRPTVAAPARQTRKQVNVNLSAEQFAQLDRMADEQDLQTSSMARMLLAGALERPRIPAKVATAAMRAGVPVLAFAAMLMELGLAEHLRGPAAREHA